MARVHQRCSHEHGPIWYNEHDDNEREMCPLCREKARADALAQQLQEAKVRSCHHRAGWLDGGLRSCKRDTAERTAAIYRTALEQMRGGIGHAKASDGTHYPILCPSCIAQRALDEAAKETR